MARFNNDIKHPSWKLTRTKAIIYKNTSDLYIMYTTRHHDYLKFMTMKIALYYNIYINVIDNYI